MQLTEAKQQALNRAGQHYSAAYFLMTIAIDHIDSGDMEIEKIGLFHREVKQLAGRTQRAFDMFHQNFKKFIPKDAGAVVLRDYEVLTKEINRVLDLKL